MKIKDSFNHFVVIVAGDNPDELMKKYDMSLKSDKPRVVYKFKDIPVLRKRYMEMMSALLNNDDLNEEEKDNIKEELDDIKNTSDSDFFYNITEDLEYDDKTGDAVTRDNPNGKWLSYTMGKIFSVPFVLKNGDTSFSARKGDIDWEKIHMSKTEVYESAWDMVMGNKKPETEEDEIIYNNMKNRTAYFSKFVTKENYVMSSTAFWGYAFLDENGWYEIDYDTDQYDWMKNYFSNFIEPQTDERLLTIFECRRN